MTVTRFTDLWISRLKPGSERTEYTDAACANLKLRVSTRGRKTFLVRGLLGPDGKRPRRTLGDYPAVSLADARRRAEAENTAALEATGTVKDLFDEYVAALTAGGAASVSDVERVLLIADTSAVVSLGANTLARHVTPAAITDYLGQVFDRAGGKRMNKIRSFLHTAFERGLKADNDPARPDRSTRYGIAANPVAAVATADVGDTSRDRVLSIEDLHLAWHRMGDAGDPLTRIALQLHIAMGGLRVEELTHSRFDQWDLDGDKLLYVPAEASKNGRENHVPAIPAAIELVRTLRAINPASDFLFPVRGDPTRPRAHQWYSRAVRKLSEDEGMEPWQPRDIRRTVKTHLNDRGADEQDVDRWQNHAMRNNVSRKHYNRAQYLDQKWVVAGVLERLVAEVISGGSESSRRLRPTASARRPRPSVAPGTSRP